MQQRVCAAALCAMLSAPPVFAACGLSGQVDALVAELGALSQGPQVLSSGVARDIAQRVAAIDMSDVTARLRQHDLMGQSDTVNRFISHAARISQDGQIRDIDHLRAAVRQIEQVIDAACPDDGPRDVSMPSQGLSADHTLSKGAPYRMRDLEPRYPSVAIAGLLMLILGATIAVLLIAQYMHSWWYAAVYSRKTCRILAAIESGCDVIDGAITVLGRRDCHFEPANTGDYIRLAALSEQDNWFVLIGTHRLSARADRLHDGWIAVRLEATTPLDLHDRLLKGSIISPQLANDVAPTPRRRAKTA